MRDLDGTTGTGARRQLGLLAAIVLATVPVLPACGAHATNGPVASAEASGPLDANPPPGQDRARLKQAIKLMDAGSLDESTRILEDLHQRYPLNGQVLHELGLVYRLSKHPDKTIALLAPHRDELLPDTLAELGSAYDEAGKPDDAVRVLTDGLRKHPDVGLLYSELATTLRGHGKLDEALALYEQGIKVDPAAPANYVNAAVMLSQTDRRGMTLIYGETFRVLEPNSDRSAAVAQLMVEVCDKAVTVETKDGKTDAHVMLAPSLVVEPSKAAKLDFPLVNAFELAFGLGLVMAHKHGPLSLESLHAARKGFVEFISKKDGPYDWSKERLFVWLRQLDADGQLEAYDYWLYGPAFAKEHDDWLAKHGDRMHEMAVYLNNHPLFPPD